MKQPHVVLTRGCFRCLDLRTQFEAERLPLYNDVFGGQV